MLLGRRRFSVERLGLAERVQGLRHVGLQGVGPPQFSHRDGHVSILQERVAQPIGGFGAARPEPGLSTKLLLRFLPLLAALIKIAQVKVCPGEGRLGSQGFPVLRLRFPRLLQRPVIRS